VEVTARKTQNSRAKFFIDEAPVRKAEEKLNGDYTAGIASRLLKVTQALDRGMQTADTGR
jgi:hypothetical protein